MERLVKRTKLTLYIVYVLSLIGAAYAVNIVVENGFYIWRFWAWVLG